MSERKPSQQAMGVARELCNQFSDGQGGKYWVVRTVRDDPTTEHGTLITITHDWKVAQRIDQAAEERYRAVVEACASALSWATHDEGKEPNGLRMVDVLEKLRAALQAARGEE